MKILNVAEKNDAAKSLADIMSRGRYRRREGFSQYNKIYEFDFHFRGQQCGMLMTSVSGHLLQLDFLGQYRSWRSCSPVALFDAPVELFCPQDYENIKKTLEREIRGCQKLIIWTDCDREGENIGFEIIQVCRAVKPNVEILRARFSEITNQAVAAAVQNASQPDENVSLAVDVRRELDLRIGAAFTRFLTLRYRLVFPDVLSEQLVSYGSCQFPTLGFVVERYKQIQQFVAEPFWKIRVLIKHSTGIVVEFHWMRIRLFNQGICSILYHMCLERPQAKVLDVKSKSKSKWRPVALDTVEFEKVASRKLRMTAKEAMQVAESLYTKGFISYPRTETNQFPPDIDLASLVEKQTADGRWGEFAARLLEAGPTPRNGNKSDQAHPPIHPLKHTAALQGREQVVYEFVVRHFLACCSQDAKGFETTVEIDIAGERFYASGLVVTERNYLEVYPYEKWSDKELPEFRIGETHDPQSIEMPQGQTSAPSLLTEADLIALMEKHGIGTDATHAEHIETVKLRSYVGVQQDGHFVPGELGMGLVEGYDALGFEFSKPHLRAELESDLKLICEGRKDKDEVLQEQLRKYKELFVVSLQQAQRIDTEMAKYLGEAKQVSADLFPAAADPVMPCPACGQPMTLRQRPQPSGAYYIGCAGYPRCQAAMWLPTAISEASVQPTKCSNCSPAGGGRDVRLLKMRYKRGSVPPALPAEHEACVLCNPDLKEAFNLSVKVSSTASGASSSGRATPAVRTLTGPGYGGPRGAGTAAGGSGIASASRVPRGPPEHQAAGNVAGQRPTGGTNAGSGPATIVQRQGAADGSGGGGSAARGASGRTCDIEDAPAARGAVMAVGDAGDGDANVNRFAQIRNATPRTMHGAVTDRSRAHDAMTASNMQPQSVVCTCGLDAVCLTVKKQGPNCGRQFYKCARPFGEQTCNFFLWADDSHQAAAGSPAEAANGDAVPARSGGGVLASYSQPAAATDFRMRSNAGFSSRNSTSVAAGSENVQCRCGQPAKQLTVNKDGPNKGRPFFGCSQPLRELQCGFFQWADAEPTPQAPTARPAGRLPGAGRGVARSTAAAAGGSTTRRRKCGFCGREGHVRTRCPDVPGNS